MQKSHTTRAPNPASAAALAKNSDVAIVFVYRWETEGDDAPSLALPENQDDLSCQGCGG